MSDRPYVSDRRRWPGQSRAAPVGVIALAVAWAALLFAAFRPGLMSTDSLVQFGQGLQKAYSNQHPPLGSFLFGLSGRLFGTPAGILALQLALIGGGFALLVRPAARERGGAALLLTAAFLATPSTWAIAVVLWKDVLLAGVLLIACAALRAGRAGAAIALAIVAALLRHDGIFAAAPLAAGAAWTSPALRTRRARAAVFTAAIGAMVIGPGVVERVARARDVWPVGQLLVYDLAGIYVRHPEALSSSSLARDITAEDLQQLYTPLTGGPLLFPARPGDPGISFHGLADRRELAGEWLRAVRAHPRAYLAHRWSVFRALLGLHAGPAFAPYHDGLDPNPWQLRLARGPAYLALTRLRDAARESPVFRGWWWLALCGVATAFAAANARRDAVPLWIALSGLAYALAHLGISVAAELRYLYWTALSPFAVAAAALAFRSTAHCERPPTISIRRSVK